MTPAIETIAPGKSYRNGRMHQLRALDDVSLRVEQGEIFRSPLTRIVLVTDVGFVAARTLVILLVLLGGSMSVMATHTVHFPSFWILSTASTSVLSLGIVVNTSLKMLFAEDRERDLFREIERELRECDIAALAPLAALNLLARLVEKLRQ